MELGIKISKKGLDVKSASLNDLSFHSEYPSMMGYKAGRYSTKFTSNHPNSYTDVVLSHNLGYKPAIQAFMDDGDTGDFYKPTGVSNPYYNCPVVRYTFDETNSGNSGTLDNLDERVFTFYTTNTQLVFQYIKSNIGSAYTGYPAGNWNNVTFNFKYYLFLKKGDE
jgi:hypothetical protein